ncbi:MAG TPA: rhomboid family intramembrane serine protease [Gaiellaceae bacterium]|nr:rhomboid family intramembrane serine protease [Gaiellaceae bacterium]
MTPAAVGIRCPDHAGSARRVQAPRIVRRASRGATQALVTRVLIGINVLIYLIGAVQGSGLNDPLSGSSLSQRLWLDGPDVAHGDWWRLITAAFLHANLIHIGFNMLALWWFGGPVEEYLGRARYLGLYIVSGLAGSAGALVTNKGVTVGASGAIFGILGSMAIIEWAQTGRFLGGNAITLIVINLAIGLAYNSSGGNISIGGHIGGLIGGVLATLSFGRWGRGHAAYGKLGITGIAGLVLIAAASVALSYYEVRAFR